jgi:hypothetical protein
VIDASTLLGVGGSNECQWNALIPGVYDQHSDIDGQCFAGVSQMYLHKMGAMLLAVSDQK